MKLIPKIAFNSMIIGRICGDKCVGDGGGICQCGDDKFGENEHFYCCTPSNFTCKYQGSYEYRDLHGKSQK